MDASKIRLARKKAGLTQGEVSDRVPGLLRTTLAAIEREDVSPSDEMAESIMAAIETLRKEREDGLSSRV